jgi:hypothetical protein
MILACSAGVAAASALIPASPQSVSAELEAIAVPGSDRIGAATPDPESGPPWAVRSYTGGSGRSCVAAARLENDQFGPMIGGRVVQLPVDESGSCADLSIDRVQLVVSRFAETADTADRTVIFGRAETGVDSLVVDDPSGTHSLKPSDGDGTFLIVLSGLLPSGAVRLHYRSTSGGTSTQTV